MTNTASQKQIDYINSLKEQRVTNSAEASAALQISRDLWTEGAFTTKAASALIDILKSQPLAAKQDAPVATTPATEGMHMLNGVVFKVQPNKSGTGLYALRLVAKADGGHHFIYAPGVIRSLSEDTKMTLEQAKDFGVQYGSCCVCGRLLTNPDSIALGIGPVCAGRF